MFHKLFILFTVTSPNIKCFLLFIYLIIMCRKCIHVDDIYKCKKNKKTDDTIIVLR